MSKPILVDFWLIFGIGLKTYFSLVWWWSSAIWKIFLHVIYFFLRGSSQTISKAGFSKMLRKIIWPKLFSPLSPHGMVAKIRQNLAKNCWPNLFEKYLEVSTHQCDRWWYATLPQRHALHPAGSTLAQEIFSVILKVCLQKKF